MKPEPCAKCGNEPQLRCGYGQTSYLSRIAEYFCAHCEAAAVIERAEEETAKVVSTWNEKQKKEKRFFNR